MIGDSETGIAAGRTTGIATILLRSGQKIASPNADLVGADLAEAVRLILTIELTTKISSLGPMVRGYGESDTWLQCRPCSAERWRFSMRSPLVSSSTSIKRLLRS